MLLTSELATNAIQPTATGHPGDTATCTGTGTSVSAGADGTFIVAIWHPPPFVRVEVTDDGSASAPVSTAGDRLSASGRGLLLVASLAATGLSASGRGLLLVASLAARWGHHAAHGAGSHGAGNYGRVTWFELRCPGDDPCRSARGGTH